MAAITGAPAPTNETDFKSFLGLVNYYAKFLPNLATVLAPLYQLLCKDVEWQWKPEQEAAFEEVKKLLKSSQLLVHFDRELPIVLACDVSPYGVGAVLSHRLQDGSEKPIAFASRTLAKAERNYSQLDKEALAVIFGVKHFHEYIYGQPFTILSDHKPLLRILSESKATPLMASARLQRWSLLLGAYQYRIQYKAGSAHANADALSRLPLPTCPAQVPLPPETIKLMEHLDSTPVTASQIRTLTSRDPLLSKVKHFIQHGWPDSTEPELKPFTVRKDELSIQDGCLLWGRRVVVPPQVREEVMLELHEAHPGMARMKSLARQYVWWPGIDADLEQKVKTCKVCQSTRNSPAPAPLHPWEWPRQPWSRVHADYAGPFMGQMFLLLVDAHTKWMDIHIVPSATSQLTIEKMRKTFATLGLPEMLVTDNDSVFTSSEFADFVKCNGIRHVTSSPYHPSSNGLAERAVQTMKNGLKKLVSGSLETKLARFLFKYRLTPQTVTEVSPAELMFGRPLRSQLDLLQPNIQVKVQSRQERQKSDHDRHARSREFKCGDLVHIRNFGQGPMWIPGVVIQVRGPVSYTVKLANGEQKRRHVDHIRPRVESVVEREPDWADAVPSRSTEAVAPQPAVLPTDESNGNEAVAAPPTLRRSSRIRQAPERFGH